MSGHSKWNNIKRKKEKTDGSRAKIFTKIGRELAVAVKEGGGTDPSINSKLRDCIAKAKANNVPNENIERIIKKAAGGDGQDNYESIRYEGYGPEGVAVIVDTLTDNRNRTAADLRHAFDKHSGNMGTTGCVSYLFNEKGIIIIDGENVDHEKFMEDVIESGASDFTFESGVYEIETESHDFNSVREYFSSKDYKFISAEIEMVPTTYVSLSNEESITKFQKMLDMLENNDDVQNVFHNWNESEYDDLN